jgi:REP element-mobilizing transposase RayT
MVMQMACHDFGYELGELNGADDHMHLLIAFPDRGAGSAGRQPQWHLLRR